MSDASQSLIRFMLSDIDGTLLRPDHSLSQTNIDAVRQLREAGIHFSVASSRPPRAMRNQIEALGIDLPTVGFNGANIINPDGSLLKAHRIDVAAARTSLELFAEERVSVWVFADDQWLLLDPQGDYVEHERSTLGYDFVQVRHFDDYIERIDKIVAASKDFELLKQLEARLNPLIADQALAARSQSYYLDVTARDANKGSALATIAEALGVPLSRTAAIGDAGNDVAMFLRAGMSIAMGQAEPAVKKHAQYVTDSNLHDGLASAIERYILPR